MATPTDLMEQNQQGTKDTLDDSTRRMTLYSTQDQNHIATMTHDAAIAQIDIKLDGKNYALWTQNVEMNISGRDKLGYINGDILQPKPDDPTFRKWRIKNTIVKGWLINLMNPFSN